MLPKYLDVRNCYSCFLLEYQCFLAMLFSMKSRNQTSDFSKRIDLARKIEVQMRTFYMKRAYVVPCCTCGVRYKYLW